MFLQPKRRWLRFSLRSMLLALTVLGVWLGIETDRAFKQRRAVAMVRKFGGMVGYRHQRMGPSNWDPSLEPWAPAWLRQLVGEDYFVSVFEVYLAHYGNSVDPPLDVLKQLSEEDLACLAGLPGLERLELAQAPITPGAISRLAGLEKLEYVDLRGTPITDAHLEQLGRLRHLKDLRLGSHGTALLVRGSPITDRGISHLKRLRRLETLFLDDLPVTDAGLAELNGLMNLRDLSIRGTLVTGAMTRDAP